MAAVTRSGTILLGKYRVDSALGRGAMGIVFKVTHMHGGEELAIKILSPEAAASPEVHARFRWEAQSVIRLRGEHVAKVIDVGLLPGGEPYLVMEYLRGLDLAAELARRGMLFPGEAVDYVLQAIEALAEAHAQGIVHRDLKPSNLFLTTRPDGTALIKVLDFGISKAAVAHNVLGRTDTVMGAPGYMAPEQMNAIEMVDPRADIWALGIVLYEFLTGRRPFDADTYTAVALLVATEPPPAIDAHVPPALQAVVLRCLEKDAKARFPSVAALGAALAPFAHDQRAAALSVERTHRIARGVRSAIEVTAPAVPAAMAMTPGGFPTRPTRPTLPARASYRRAGIIALIASIVAVSVAALLVARDPSMQSTAPGPSPAARPREDRAATASLPVATDGSADRSPAAAAAAAARVEHDRDAERARKLAGCSELQTQKRWQALEVCASELDDLGGSDQAKELRATATQEALNEAEDGKVRRALRDGDLKAADASLQLITPDSIYVAALREAFLGAEDSATEDAKRSAQSLARARDCGGLRRLVAQLTASATDRVVAAAQAARCGDRTVAEAPRASAGRTAAQAPRASAERTAAQAPRASAEPTAAQAPRASAEPTAAQAPRVSTEIAAPAASTANQRPAPAAPRTASSKTCDTANVDDLMTRAAIQYDNGNPRSALSLAVVALGCKQTSRMYWLAVLYACAAHDLAAAKLYFREVPANLQAGIERTCQKEELDVRSR